MARATFQVWVVIYAPVGAQMGWVLRPFIGDRHIPVTFFVFSYVYHIVREKYRSR